MREKLSQSKPPVENGKSKRDSAEQDLLDALERLKCGRPTNDLLIERATRNRLYINPLTVSLEANRSRTLIGMDDCAYPAVRALVLAEGNAMVRYQPRIEEVRAAKAEVRKMQEINRVKDSALAAAYLRIDQLEAKLREYGIAEPNVRPIRSKREPGARASN